MNWLQRKALSFALRGKMLCDQREYIMRQFYMHMRHAWPEDNPGTSHAVLNEALETVASRDYQEIK